MINRNLVPLLKMCLGGVAAGGAIMTLGRQTLNFGREALPALIADGHMPRSQSGQPDTSPYEQEQLFADFGFAHVHSLDVSPYEKCTHLHDLNAPDLPTELVGKYRVVLNGGTLEHVFDFVNGLSGSLKLLEPGGVLVHGGPINDWVDHGFYQFSPTLWFDLAAVNGFDVLLSMAVVITEHGDRQSYRVVPLPAGEGKRITSALGRTSHLVVLRCPQTVGSLVVPKQSMYLSKHGDDLRSVSSQKVFEPFDVVDGKVVPLPRQSISIDAKSVRVHSQRTYKFRMPENVAPGGNRVRPFRSDAILVEDGKPYENLHASADAIETAEPGAFCHFGRQLFFSTADGGDPRKNGRTYSISLPD